MKTRHIFISAVLAIVMIVSCCITVVATPKPSDSFYVYDDADVISEETEKHIVAKNKNLEYSTGAEIVVVAVKTTNGEPIKEFAGKIYTEWSIGDSDKKNGMLILFVIDVENYWIMPGTGIDDKLTQQKLRSMFDNFLEPYFKEKDYDRGALTFFDKLIVEFEEIYDVKLDNVTEEEESGVGFIILVIFLVIVGVAILGFIAFVVIRNISYNKYRRGMYRPSVKIPPGERARAQLPPSAAQNGSVPRQNGAVPRQNGAMPRQNGNYRN